MNVSFRQASFFALGSLVGRFFAQQGEKTTYKK